jgi:hypothetical protein
MGCRRSSEKPYAAEEIGSRALAKYFKTSKNANENRELKAFGRKRGGGLIIVTCY